MKARYIAFCNIFNSKFVTSFQLQRVSNLALSVLSSRVSLLFVLLPTRDVSPHNSSQFATSFAFRNLHKCNLLPFCSAFRQLTAYLFSIFTHSFSDCSLGNCHLFFTELSHLEQLFILDTSLATGWKNYFGTYCTYLLFFVLRMFAIDLGTIVKVISRSPDSLGFIFCMLASRPSLLC